MLYINNLCIALILLSVASCKKKTSPNTQTRTSYKSIIEVADAIDQGNTEIGMDIGTVGSIYSAAMDYEPQKTDVAHAVEIFYGENSYSLDVKVSTFFCMQKLKDEELLYFYNEFLINTPEAVLIDFIRLDEIYLSTNTNFIQLANETDIKKKVKILREGNFVIEIEMAQFLLRKTDDLKGPNK